jgi:hypothetical protein
MGMTFYLGNVINILKDKNIYLVRYENLQRDIDGIGTYLHSKNFDPSLIGKTNTQYLFKNHTINCTKSQMEVLRDVLTPEYNMLDKLIQYSVNK